MRFKPSAQQRYTLALSVLLVMGIAGNLVMTPVFGQAKAQKGVLITKDKDDNINVVLDPSEISNVQIKRGNGKMVLTVADDDPNHPAEKRLGIDTILKNADLVDVVQNGSNKQVTIKSDRVFLNIKDLSQPEEVAKVTATAKSTGIGKTPSAKLVKSAPKIAIQPVSQVAEPTKVKPLVMVVPPAKAIQSTSAKSNPSHAKEMSLVSVHELSKPVVPVKVSLQPRSSANKTVTQTVAKPVLAKAEPLPVVKTQLKPAVQVASSLPVSRPKQAQPTEKKFQRLTQTLVRANPFAKKALPPKKETVAHNTPAIMTDREAEAVSAAAIAEQEPLPVAQSVANPTYQSKAMSTNTTSLTPPSESESLLPDDAKPPILEGDQLIEPDAKKLPVSGAVATGVAAGSSQELLNEITSNVNWLEPTTVLRVTGSLIVVLLLVVGFLSYGLPHLVQRFPALFASFARMQPQAAARSYQSAYNPYDPYPESDSDYQMGHIDNRPGVNPYLSPKQQQYVNAMSGAPGVQGGAARNSQPFAGRAMPEQRAMPQQDLRQAARQEQLRPPVMPAAAMTRPIQPPQIPAALAQQPQVPRPLPPLDRDGLMRRQYLERMGQDTPGFQVVSSAKLSKEKELHLVEVQGHQLVVATTPYTVNLVSDLSQPNQASMSPPPLPQNSMPLLEVRENETSYEQPAPRSEQDLYKKYLNPQMVNPRAANNVVPIRQAQPVQQPPQQRVAGDPINHALRQQQAIRQDLMHRQQTTVQQPPIRRPQPQSDIQVMDDYEDVFNPL